MILVKVGGGKDINWEYIASDPVMKKENVIIVHGGNAAMKDVSKKLGISERMITSPSGHVSRHTDSQTIELLTMTYSGLMNKKIVSTLQRYGMNAIGLTGADGKLWRAKRKKAILAKKGTKTKLIQDSQTGKVISVNTQLLTLLLDSGYTPVLTIPAITDDGELVNVDNDRAVAVMVRELRISDVVMLFEASGLLTDVSDPTSVVPQIAAQDIEKYSQQVTGRMKKKLLGVKESFEAGCTRVCFGDGRMKQPVSDALSGKGTVIA